MEYLTKCYCFYSFSIRNFISSLILQFKIGDPAIISAEQGSHRRDQILDVHLQSASHSTPLFTIPTEQRTKPQPQYRPPDFCFPVIHAHNYVHLRSHVFSTSTPFEVHRYSNVHNEHKPDSALATRKSRTLPRI